jgi:uncharacterized membrane protein
MRIFFNVSLNQYTTIGICGMSLNNKSEESNNNGSKKALWRLSIIAFIAAVFVVGMYIYNFSFSLSDKPEEWALFGDYLGGTLNPILSFLSLIAILITLGYQVKELNASTRELSNSSLALKEQSKSLKLQAFENTFFQMLKLHNDVVRGMDIQSINGKETLYSGRDCFSYFVRQVNTKINDEHVNSNIVNISEVYLSFQKSFGSDTDHYFRNLFTIVKYIDEATITEFGYERKKYIDILGAQLSTNELVLLFFNCLGAEYKKFKYYLEKYSLLENMDLDKVGKDIEIDSLSFSFSEHSFGDSYDHEPYGYATLFLSYDKSAYGNNEQAKKYFKTI